MESDRVRKIVLSHVGYDSQCSIFNSFRTFLNCSYSILSEGNKTMTMNVFLSYAYKDEPWRDELAAYLSNLRWQGIITDWHERNISVGREWSREIDPDLDTAQIIL